MIKNKTLLLLDNEEIRASLKENRNITFLFPVEKFSIGFQKSFKLSEITEEAYIFVNRIMDNKTIEEFKSFITNIPANIKGIVFDDIGVLNILKDNKKLKKILFLNHFNCNYESINIYLDYVDSVVISPDITIAEIDEILSHVKKEVVLYTFGHVNIMYSRRTLISNYNANFNTKAPLLSELEDTTTAKKFKIMESIYGTVIYTKEPYNALELRSRKPVLYNLINTVFLNKEEVLNIINSNTNLEDIYPYKYLGNSKMIVKLKDINESKGEI